MTRLLALLAIAFASITTTARADDRTPPTLVVTGSAVAEVEPDQLEVRFAVVSSAENVEDALEDNSRRMRRVLDELARAGIEDTDLETEGFNVSPEYSRNRGNDAPRKITGYTVRNTILARTTDLALAGDLIETGVDAGADSVSNLSFGLADPQAHRAEAIAMATANARADAEALAAAAGLKLAGILEITLDPQQGYQPRFAAREMGVMADAAPPIRPGEVSLSARVRIVYSLGKQTVSAVDARESHAARTTLPYDYSLVHDVLQPYEHPHDSSVFAAAQAAEELFRAIWSFNYPAAQLLTKPGTMGHRQFGEIATKIQQTARDDVMESIRIAKEVRGAFGDSYYAQIQVLSFDDESASLRFHLADGSTIDCGAELVELPDGQYHKLKKIENGMFVQDSFDPDSRLAWVIVPPKSGFLTLP